MSKTRKQPFAPFKVRCTRDVDYVTAGEVYTVSSENGARLYFTNDRTGGGTSLEGWQVAQALKAGALSYVTEGNAQ